MDWKEEYIKKFRTLDIKEDILESLIEEVCSSINELFQSSSINKKIDFDATQNIIIFPDCTIKYTIENEKGVQFTRPDSDNECAICKSLRVNANNKGYYTITKGIGFSHSADAQTQYNNLDIAIINKVFELLVM